jgi:hypothetical protein
MGDLLEHNIGAASSDRFSAPDQKFWDYDAGGIPVSLHWQQAGGLALVAGNTELATEQWMQRTVPTLLAKIEEHGKPGA